MIHSSPNPDEQVDAEAIGAAGAYVSCWVDFVDADGAEVLARHYIMAGGWIPGELEEARAVERSDYKSSSDELAYFDEAVETGSSFNFICYLEDDGD